MKFDFASLSKYEQGALVAGGVAVLLSFFPSYIRASFDGGGIIRGVSAGTNAWSSYATLGMLLILGATVLVAVRAVDQKILPDGLPWNLITLALAGLGTVLVILRALTASDGGLGYSVGPGWSGWLLFIATITLTAFCALLFKDSGEKLPELKKDDPPTMPGV